MFGLFSKKKSSSPLQYAVAEAVSLGKNVNIGLGSIIGYGNPKCGPIHIGDDVTIGAYCLIQYGAIISDGSHIDDYCKVGYGAKIGDNCKLLYGKHIYDDAIIGNNCIIGGHVADRTVIEDNVTYMGEIAHAHRHPSEGWDETEEDSPIIRKGSVIGLNALLIGGIQIGPCAYVGAGEIVRVDVGEGMCFIKGDVRSLKSFRGIFKSRCK